MKGTKLDFYRANVSQKAALFAKKPSFVRFYMDRARKYGSLRKFPNIIVSYPKSGRTWLQKLIIEAVRLETGQTEEFSDITEASADADIPLILSTHAGSSWEEWVRDYKSVQKDDWQKYDHAKIIFLVRDPRDVLVSQYHHIRHRTGYEKFDKNYLVRNPNVGILKIIHFMNKWQRYFETYPEQVFRMSYEDMRKDTEAELIKMFDFWGLKISGSHILQAIENCTLERMKKKEQSHADSPWMVTSDKSNSNAFQSRKGMIGEYKEFFDQDDIDYINTQISEHLDPSFGYH